MNAAGALQEFAGLPLWVAWRYETRQGSDKPTKVPYAHTGLKASSINPGTWSTRAIAEHTAKRDNRDGIGIVLAPLGEGRHLGGVDLDTCIDDEGTVTAWAREIVDLLDSYTEISPSGHGLKVVFTHDERVTLSKGTRWRKEAKRPAPNGGKEPGIEFYLQARYFTVTDATFEQYDTIRAVDFDTLRHVQRLMEVFDQKPKAPTHRPRRHDDEHGLVLDALSSIPGEDDYNEWVRVGMALHFEVQGSPEGCSAFVAWSAKSSKFDAHHCEQKWREWDRRPADRLTGGTIIYLARQNGWQDPRQAKSNGAAIENAADVENATDPTAEWPDIDPALTESARRDIPVFPVFLFPPAWRKWTVATAEGAGAPVDYVAMGLLGNVAGVTGCGVFVEVTASWREPVVVWTAAVGAPGMSKTPALAATRRLIDAVECAARDKDAERQREHETKAEAAKLAEEKWREEVAEAAEADKPPPTKPAAADRIEPFIPTQMVIEDATTESIVDVVRGNPRGVVLWRDEITAWLKNFSRYNAGSDRGFWLERWPASDAIVNRKARSTVRIQRLGVSIVGGIQPDRLGEICGDDDDGMASRFLFAWPERPPYKPLQERLAGSDDSAIERLQRIYALAGDAEQPLVLKLDAGAVEVLNEFCAEHHAEASEYEGLEAGWYGKGQGYVARLAGVLTLLAWSETGSAGLPSTITAEAVHAAAGLWSGYYWPVARTIFARTGKTLANRQVRRIIAWIRRTEASTISVEDVRVSALGRTVDATDAAGLIARLVRYHVLRPPHPAARGPGKPPIRWDVNPALHTPQPEDAHA